MSWLSDWRALTVVYVVAFGLWGFLAKLGSEHLRWTQLTLVIMVTNLVIVSLVTIRDASGMSGRGVALAALAGLFAAVGSLTMYRALSLASASIVIPLSSLYVVVTAGLSIALLGEPLTARKALGLALGLAAIMLLAADPGRGAAP